MAQIYAITMKMDAQYKEPQSRLKQSTIDNNDDDTPMSREEEAKFIQTFHGTRFYNDYRDRDSNRQMLRKICKHPSLAKIRKKEKTRMAKRMTKIRLRLLHADQH
nr:hypothetical protein [Tanacetum cinerariifolium]